MLVGAVGRATAADRAGKRQFPETIAVPEPFVEDEITFPSFLHIRRPASGGEPPTTETQISTELKKLLTPTLQLALGGGLVQLDPNAKPSKTGFANLDVALKYQIFESALHETLLSLSLGWEVGGTGRKATGAASFDAVKPTFHFGKGLGDLPEGLRFFKPLAVTGALGAAIPTRARTRTVTVEKDTGETKASVIPHPDVLQWGLVIQYSIPYLQSFVKDAGLPPPVDRLFPVVEFSFDTFLDRGSGGTTNGTVNPGVVWVGELFQVGLEAVIPINDRTGKNVGVRGLLRFALDELLPSGFIQPFGERPR